jgi:hypothetical protein
MEQSNHYSLFSRNQEIPEIKATLSINTITDMNITFSRDVLHPRVEEGGRQAEETMPAPMNCNNDNFSQYSENSLVSLIAQGARPHLLDHDPGQQEPPSEPTPQHGSDAALDERLMTVLRQAVAITSDRLDDVGTNDTEEVPNIDPDSLGTGGANDQPNCEGNYGSMQ